jgi:hypothetical protein
MGQVHPEIVSPVQHRADSSHLREITLNSALTLCLQFSKNRCLFPRFEFSGRTGQPACSTRNLPRPKTLHFPIFFKFIYKIGSIIEPNMDITFMTELHFKWQVWMMHEEIVCPEFSVLILLFFFNSRLDLGNGDSDILPIPFIHLVPPREAEEDLDIFTSSRRETI